MLTEGSSVKLKNWSVIKVSLIQADFGISVHFSKTFSFYWLFDALKGEQYQGRLFTNAALVALSASEQNRGNSKRNPDKRLHMSH